MKTKKILAALLTAAVLVVPCTLGVNAAEKPVWDESKSGSASITIHNLEYNGDAESSVTGAEEQNALQEATALPDVTFTLWKVQEETWLENYYDSTGTAEELAKIKPDDYYEVDAETGKITVSEKTGIKQVTNNGGIATFGNLAFGLYLVAETDAPAKVSVPVEPFLVSVPMTNAEGKGWLYDVHVYPKNGTALGEVTINQTFYVGGTEQATKPAGVVYTLEKKKSADSDEWEEVTQNADTEEAYVLESNASGTLKITGLTVGDYRIRIKEYTGESNKGYILDGSYRYFTVTNQSRILDEDSKEITQISFESDKPDLTKTIQTAEEIWEQAAQYGGNEEVAYKITVAVPNNIDKLKIFKVTDISTDFQWDTTKSIKITYQDTELLAKTEQGSTGIYTVSNKENAFAIDFDMAELVPYKGKTLEITYNATVDPTAAIGGNGNLSTATLTYTNQIDENGVAADTTNHISDSTVVYAFGLEIKSIDEEQNALNGPVFSLYKVVDVEHYTEGDLLDTDTSQKYGLDDLGVGKGLLNLQEEMETADGGTIDIGKVYGIPLSNGTYYLVETATKKGYNLLPKPVKVELNITATPTWSAESYDDDGNLTKHGSVTSTEYTNSDKTDLGYKIVTIINRVGFTLPATGGRSAAVLGGVGGVLVLAGAGLLLGVKKKKDE